MPTNPPHLDEYTARWLPWLVAMSFFMQMLDGTILNTALPAIARSLGENPLRMQAVIIAYLLAQAICIPASGWLTDRWGPRSLMGMSIGFFTFGSLLCALSTDLYFMVAARVVQGLGGALMVPVGRLVILRLYPKGELVRVLSIIPIPGLFGNLIGPALGGFLVEYASWHWIFLINLPVGIFGIWATLKLMPRFEPDREHRFDFIGFIVFGLSLVLLSLGTEGLGNPDISMGAAALLAFGGLAVQIFYWLVLSRRTRSLFKPSIFKTNTFSVGLAANLFARLGSSAIPFLTPLLLQVGLGYSPLTSGLMMIPMAMASVVAKMATRPLAARFQYRSILLTNTCIQGLLIVSLAFASTHMYPPLFCLQLALMGGVNSLQFSFLNTYTLMDLPYEDSGSGNALMSVMMQLSMSLGVGLAAAVLMLFHGTPEAGGGAGSESMLVAFQHTFLTVGATAVLSALLFFLAPKK